MMCCIHYIALNESEIDLDHPKLALIKSKICLKPQKKIVL